MENTVKFFCLFSPCLQEKSKNKIETVKRVFAVAGKEVTFYETQRAGHAKEIAARKFGVKHTYRFYVKDMSTSNGKLEMKVCENGVWKSMGVYVEIGPEGSKILTQAEADAEDNKNNKQ